MTELLNTHTAIVGASGAGKTVTAKGHAEALLNARRHVCIIDPTSAWWGLRSNVAGDGPGFDIPIFGGPHGDVVITADQGEVIGAIIAGGVSAIVDMSSLRTGSEQRRFARDLCRRLRAKPDGNFHLIVDEADEFASQKPRDDYGFQVGEELIWMAKRGRLAGFVLTLITQRPASIDKEVLTQAQTLIIHQLVAPVDQKPIVDYIRDSADKVTVAAIRGSLASLDRGERWIYSPRLNVLERGVSPAIDTFDSSRTPGPGEQAVEPRMLASIDLAEIRKALAPPPVEVPADPAAAYQAGSEAGAMIIARDARIAELEAERDEWTIERAYGQQQLEAVLAENRLLREYSDQIAAVIADIARIRPALDEVEAVGTGVEEKPPVHSRSKEPLRSDSSQERRPATLQSGSAVRPSPTHGAPTASTPGTLPPGTRPALAVLASAHPAGMTRGQLAARLGIKKKGSTLASYLSRLRTSGLIEERDGLVFASKLGAASIGEIEPMPAPGPDLARSWAAKLPGTPPVVELLLESYPMWSERALVAEALDINPTGSTIASYISRLFTAGVIEKDGSALRLSAEVMES